MKSRKLNLHSCWLLSMIYCCYWSSIYISFTFNDSNWWCNDRMNQPSSMGLGFRPCNKYTSGKLRNIPCPSFSLHPTAGKVVILKDYSITTPLETNSPQADTLPETNSNFAPENRPGPKRKRESIPTIHFQVRTVSFREGIQTEYTVGTVGPFGWSILRKETYASFFLNSMRYKRFFGKASWPAMLTTQQRLRGFGAFRFKYFREVS